MEKKQDSIGAPAVGIDGDTLLSPLSAWCKSKGIKNDAEFSAAVDAMTDAQIIAVVRLILKRTIVVTPHDWP